MPNEVLGIHILCVFIYHQTRISCELRICSHCSRLREDIQLTTGAPDRSAGSAGAPPPAGMLAILGGMSDFLSSAQSLVRGGEVVVMVVVVFMVVALQIHGDWGWDDG